MKKISAEEADYLMSDALIEACGATCTKKKVGAILIGRNESLKAFYKSGGYGGPSENGNTQCIKDKNGLCARKTMNWAQDGCWSVHSEQRALLTALKECTNQEADSFMLKDLFPGFDSWTMFVTHGPCDQCLKFMHHFGVDTVVYDIEYKTDYTKWEGHIEILQLEEYKRSLDA